MAAVAAQIADSVGLPRDNFADEGNVNGAIPTARHARYISRTIFRLHPNASNTRTGFITVPAGENMIIIAPKLGRIQKAASPQLRWISIGAEIDSFR